jgi:hypothetical protein
VRRLPGAHPPRFAVLRFDFTGLGGSEGAAGIRRLVQGSGATRIRYRQAWSVDRLGRSLQDLVAFLTELHALRIDLCQPTSGIDAPAIPAGAGHCSLRILRAAGTGPLVGCFRSNPRW